MSLIKKTLEGPFKTRGFERICSTTTKKHLPPFGKCIRTRELHDCHSEPKAKNLGLPATHNERDPSAPSQDDNRDTSANFAMQRHRKFLAEFRLRASQ